MTRALFFSPAFWLLSAASSAIVPLKAAGQDTMAGYLDEEYSCIMCHTAMRADFLEGVHARRGIQCTDCHGGDPTQFEADASHSSGFRRGMTKAEGVELCLSCHGSISEMRQYALEPVTREEFLESRHGQKLMLEGDTVAPSCSDCHGAHAILPRVEPRSPINHTNVSETCAKCHSDPSRFGGEMGTGQFAEWVASAHGVGLLERHNDRSANCADCHGSHSALVPGIREVPNVCGKCHQLVRDAYFDGAHREQIAAATREAGCTGCHENHGTEMPPFSEIALICQECHETESPQATAGLELQQQILRAEAAGDRAREAVESLRNSGERTVDEEIRLQTVETHLQELLVVAHSLDPAPVEDLTRRVSSLSGEIVQRAEAVGEHRWERQLLAIPVWILVLGGVLLALRKERVLRGRASSPEEPAKGGASP
ncbi:MAG: cytochrome c3 family protein [Gemmatimonadota bacterium]|jgi:hypothetical protein